MDATKGKPLRVLIAEDSENDALLVIRELKLGGYRPEMQRVDSAQEMRIALEQREWDLIIADHNMPSFDSRDALNLARQHDPNIPFIVVSGSIGEEVAVDAMKAGAHDYVMKDNLTRLLPAIDRELREAETRRAHLQAQATIHHMAYHDSLTELVNRAEFERRLNNAVAIAAGSGDAHALLYLDLDQFKLINDSCGHMAGDDLLRRLAHRMQHSIRESDTLARLGGDEFGVLLNCCPLDRAMEIAKELLSSIREYRFVWGDRTFRVGASIGLVHVTGNEKASVLLSLADMACYEAKDRGRNKVHVYIEGNHEMHQRRGEMQWIQRLQSAIAKDEMLLYRQRIQSLRGSDSHYELLLRMRDERGEIITPDRFIPAAERYNLMPEIDQWVIRTCCAQLAENRRESGPEHTQGATFINLSGNSLSNDGLIDYIQEQLQRHAIPPGRIGFEITETAAIADFDCAMKLIKTLRQHQCRVALDDFGTGMCSFAYLKSLDVDFVKIDGDFIRNMQNDPIDAAIAEAINTIGHKVNIQTIAEFVETAEILQQLKNLGVDYAQGWAVELPRPFSGGGVNQAL